MTSKNQSICFLLTTDKHCESDIRQKDTIDDIERIVWSELTKIWTNSQADRFGNKKVNTDGNNINKHINK